MVCSRPLGGVMGADRAESAVAGPKKAKPRGSAASNEPVGFLARVVERLNAFEEPAPAKGKAKARDDQWKYLVLGALDSDEELKAAITGGAPEVQLKAQATAQTAARVAYLRSHHRRRLPRHRQAGDPRPPARPRPDPRHRPQRLRQVQLRRGPRAAAHRRHLPLEGQEVEGLEGGLAQPPPPEGGDRGRVRRRRGEDARGRSSANGRTERPSKASRRASRSRASRRRTSTRSDGRRRS